MSTILSVADAVNDHWKRCADEVRRLYRDAVRPIFQRLPDGRPELIGSSVLVEFDGRKWIVTAAHVLDGHDEASRHVGTRSELIPLNGTFDATGLVEGKRGPDAVDIAVAELTPDQVGKLEGAAFVELADQIATPPLRPTDFYLAMGYRCSQNKPPKAGQTQLPVTIWSYKGLPASLPSPEKRQFGGSYNFALDYPKRAARANGETVVTTPPVGVSGGAIFQLGDLANVEQLGSVAPQRPKLAGIVVECPKGARVLIGTKLLAVRDAMASAVQRAAAVNVQSPTGCHRRC